jgi:hypothetical protein
MDDVTSRALLADPETRDAGWRVGARCIAGRGRRAIRDAGPTSCAASCCLGRSPAQRLRVEQVVDEPDVPLDPARASSATAPCVSIQLGRTKTTNADDEGKVLLVGPPVEALREWLLRSDINNGPIFRAIDRWSVLEERALTPQSITLILKKRCEMGRA